MSLLRAGSPVRPSEPPYTQARTVVSGRVNGGGRREGRDSRERREGQEGKTEDGYRRVTAVLSDDQYAWAQEVVLSGAMAGLSCSVSTVIRLALEELRGRHPSAKKLEAALRAHIWREGVTKLDRVQVPGDVASGVTAVRRPQPQPRRVSGQPPSAAPPEQPRTIRVLLAVEQAMLRAGLRTLLLDASDITVVGEATDVSTAVDLVQKEGPDVALMDLSLRGDRAAAIQAVVVANANVRVLVLGASAERDRILAAVDAGAVGYLIRDARPEELLSGIRAAARGESPLSLPAVRALLSDRPARPPLTRREQQVLALVARGLANKQIARQLGISEKTVKTHLGSTFQRLGVSDRTQAAMWAASNGLLT